jgi:hypothetical protein
VYDLPDSAKGYRSPSRRLRPCSAKGKTADQRPSESSPEPSDHFYRAQQHLRGNVIVVRVGRLAPYLEATREEQP